MATVSNEIKLEDINNSKKDQNEKSKCSPVLRKLPMRLAKKNTLVNSVEPVNGTNRALRSKTATIQTSASINQVKSTRSKASKTKQTDQEDKSNKEDKVKIKKSNSTSKSPIKKKATTTNYSKGKRQNKNARSSKCQLFFCDTCDKVYDHYSELVYHQRRHTGEKPFACTWPGCQAAFSASNSRVRHMRIHTGEKPYVCPYPECERRFTYWKDLKLHKFRHSGEKPHKCDWEGCSSRFFRRDDLKHHRYTHTGEKPYRCKFPGCESAFSQKSPLNLHMRKIHNTQSDKLQDKLQHQDNLIFSPTASTTINYSLYQPSTNNILRQTPNNNLTVLPDINHTMMLVDPSHHQHNAPSDHCIGADDKVNSILVTCDVSPATVRGVSHQFSHENRNQWSPYTVPGNSVRMGPTVIHSSHTAISQSSQMPMIKNSEIFGMQLKQSDEQQLSHLPLLNDLLSDPSQSEQDNHSKQLPGNVLNQVGDVSSVMSQNEALQTNALNSNSLHIDANNNIDNSSLPNNDITKKSIKDAATEPAEQILNQPSANIIKPVRKRANYRLKVPPSDGSKVDKVSIIRTRSATETKSQGKATSTGDDKTKKGSKRTIAIQTLKKTSTEKLAGEKFKCDFCKREFKAKHDRDCHRMTHTGEKPRACDWPGCSYRCITKSKLTRHQRKHTGERNYPCDWPGCEKKFSTSRHMKEHKRCHTGEKPFKCDWPGCDKWFSRKDHIKNHRFTHTGEKPRKCPFPGCEAAFIQLSPLKKHMELHKRDGGNVPNRTRKRKSDLERVNSEGEVKVDLTDCNNSQVNLETLEMVVSRMMPHNTIPQSFNMMIGQENQNCCLTATYDNIHNNQVNLEYDVMFRHPTYC